MIIYIEKATGAATSYAEMENLMYLERFIIVLYVLALVSTLIIIVGDLVRKKFSGWSYLWFALATFFTTKCGPPCWSLDDIHKRYENNPEKYAPYNAEPVPDTNNTK